MAVLRRPSLWRTALAQARRLAPRRWWARPPFLPLPDRAYVRFRLETQYGGAGDRRVEAHDVVSWLAWVRTFDRDLRTRESRPPRHRARR
ncbi:MAG: hypothetical protein ABIV94_00525 [Acidimicrobiales bacterium]